MIGKETANNSHLLKIIPKQASNVAAVPKRISKLAVGDKQIARKQPIVKPTEYLLLKKQSNTKISEKRNWIGPYAIGDIAIVNAA